MIRLLLRYALQALLVLAPLITVERYSLVDVLHLGTSDPQNRYHLRLLPWSWDTKEAAELQVALVLTLVAFSGVSIAEITDLYLPRRRLRTYRNAYFQKMLPDWRTQVGPDVRINIMFVKRKWYVGFLPKLTWAWGDGYRGNTHQAEDDGLSFWWFQGVCGTAYCKRQPQLIKLDAGVNRRMWPWLNPYRLSRRHLKRTEAVRAVLSIPILDVGWRERLDDTEENLRCVGVLSLDTTTAAGIQKLDSSRNQLVEYFGKDGRVLASLRG